MDSIIDEFLSTIEPSPIRLDMEIKEEEAQPPMLLVNNEEEIKLEEGNQEEEVEIEEACKEVEVVKEELKRMELEITLPKLLETSPPKPSPSIPSFKWVNLSSLSLISPLEYALLEMDRQLRALCGYKSKREMVSGKSCHVRFNMFACSKLKYKGWYNSQLNGSRKLFG